MGRWATEADVADALRRRMRDVVGVGAGLDDVFEYMMSPSSVHFARGPAPGLEAPEVVARAQEAALAAALRAFFPDPPAHSRHHSSAAAVALKMHAPKEKDFTYHASATFPGGASSRGGGGGGGGGDLASTAASLRRVHGRDAQPALNGRQGLTTIP